MNLKVGWLVLSILMLATTAFSQEQNSESTTQIENVESKQEVQDSPSDARVEKLEVTGSRIKRIDVEGPSPVLTLDRDYLDRTGFNNIGDVLRDTTVSSFGGGREASLSGGAETGASTTSLRGFGADRILVLMDGKRLPTLGGTSKVDLALIPMAAVERVEILKDGASAIYGSDALGGVINIITKKDYDGVSIDTGYTYTDKPGGDRTDVKASYGKSFSKGNILGVLQYRSNESTASKDFDYARPRLADFSTFGSPGSWKDPTNGWQAGGGADACPNGQTVPVDPDDLSKGNFCKFDYSPYSQVTPTIKQMSALLSGTYELNESVKLFARGVYTNRDVRSKLAPPPDSFRDESSIGGLNTQIPAATATGWGLGATSTGDIDWLRYRLVEEAGPRIGEVISDSFALQSGVTGYIGDTWEWEFSGTYGMSDTVNKGVSGYANKLTLYNNAVANPASFNPFNAPGSKSVITDALYTPRNQIVSSMSTANFVVSGELGEFGAGPIGAAMGVSSAWQTYDQSTDSVTGSGAQWGGGVVAVGSGLRDFQSVFSEFSILPLSNLELQAAARFDNYSDFGGTLNPRFALRYNPYKSFMFRASWGTGFRAPSLEDLYQSNTTDFPFGFDPQTQQQVQFQRIRSGNLNLREETTQSYNFGVVTQILDDLGLGVDFWGVEQNNKVTLSTVRDIFAAEQKLGVPTLNSFGIFVDREAGSNNVKTVRSPSINLASMSTQGIDINLNYSLNLSSNFRFYSAVDHSILLNYYVEAFPGLGRENRVGFARTDGSIPYWQNNVTVGLNNRVFDISLQARTIGETNADALAQIAGTGGKTRDHTELDIRGQYTAPWDGVFSMVVRNVFNTDRPQLDNYLSSGYVDTYIYDPFGRSIGLTYRQDF